MSFREGEEVIQEQKKQEAMKKPEELEMTVLTVPNGYSLDLRRGGKESGYLYFTLRNGNVD